MDPVSSCCSDLPAYGNYSASTGNLRAVQLTQVATSINQTKDITLQTEEGDKVTISYSSRTQAAYTDLRAFAYSHGYSATGTRAVSEESLLRIQGEALSLEDSRELTITVDGDLNDEELQDIKKALKEIDRIMTDLLGGGDITEAMADAEDIGDLETIAFVEADYRYEKTVLVQTVDLKEIDSSQNESDGDVASIPRKRGHRGFRGLIRQMEKAMEGSGLEPLRFKRPLQKLFNRIQQNLDGNDAIGRAKGRVAELMGEELMRSMEPAMAGGTRVDET